MKVYISQATRFKDVEEIGQVREKAAKSATRKFKEEAGDSGITIVDMFSVEPEEGTNSGVRDLANQLRVLSECDRVYFVKGWSDDRVCKIEFMVAKEFGIKFFCE